MRIECSSCEMYQSDHCDDCLVTALLSPRDDVIDLDGSLDESLRALSGAGLLPVLKFRPRAVPESGEQREASAG